MAQSQTFASAKEMLDALTESLVQPRAFTQVNYRAGNESLTSYVANEPLRSSRKNITFDNSNYVNNDGVVVRLNLPEQLYLLRGLSKRFGMKARHGSLRENLEAAYSEDGGYKKNILIPYWVFTGELIRRFDNKYDVSRTLDADFVSVQSADLVLKRDGNSLETKGGPIRTVREMPLGTVLQISIPTKTGYYSGFSGAIPVDSELGERTKESKGYFGSIYFDERDLSAVGCGWGSVRLVLLAGAGGPLGRDYGGALGVWTDEKPNK